MIISLCERRKEKKEVNKLVLINKLIRTPYYINAARRLDFSLLDMAEKVIEGLQTGGAIDDMYRMRG